MTTDDFFTELERRHDQFTWTLRPEATRTAERRAKPRLVLCAVPKDGSVSAVFDPIGALCYALTNEVYEPKDWADAADTLGISIPESASLFAAANDRTWSGPEGERKPVPGLIAMRARLIEVVDLEVGKKRWADSIVAAVKKLTS